MACSEGAPLRGERALRLLAFNDLLLMGLDPGTTNLELGRSDGSVKDGAGLFKLAGLFVKVLTLCQKAGLVKLGTWRWTARS